MSRRCCGLFSLRVSEGGCHCDPAEAFTNRDMTERTMQISLDLSHATNTWIRRLWQHLWKETEEDTRETYQLHLLPKVTRTRDWRPVPRLGWAKRDWPRGGVCHFTPMSGFVQLLKINIQNKHETGQQNSSCAQRSQRTKKLTAATL